MSDAFSPQPSEDNEPGAHGLEPNLADINAHLYAIFSPDFVKDHPGTWIEIATADPEAGEGNTGQEAAAYAVRMNKKGSGRRSTASMPPEMWYQISTRLQSLPVTPQ